ncbi:MAG: hypothetical protein V4583_20395 [Pseudomonadota bacterium]
MSDPLAIPDFGSGEEFAQLMSGLAAKLHAKNRIWMDESGYAWHVAQLLSALGEEFRAAPNDPDVIADFGDAHHKARLDDAEQVDALLARLRDRLVR